MASRLEVTRGSRGGSSLEGVVEFENGVPL